MCLSETISLWSVLDPDQRDPVKDYEGKRVLDVCRVGRTQGTSVIYTRIGSRDVTLFDPSVVWMKDRGLELPKKKYYE